MDFFTRFSQKYLYNFFRRAQSYPTENCWVSPGGKYYPTEGLKHRNWCEYNIDKLGTKAYNDGPDAQDYFFANGWIRYSYYKSSANFGEISATLGLEANLPEYKDSVKSVITDLYWRGINKAIAVGNHKTYKTAIIRLGENANNFSMDDSIDFRALDTI